jgi:hypothetical protein
MLCSSADLKLITVVVFLSRIIIEYLSVCKVLCQQPPESDHVRRKVRWRSYALAFVPRSHDITGYPNVDSRV